MAVNGIGLLLSLVTFLRSEIAGRKSKEEILRALEDDRTIRDYLEWLRRQDTADLTRRIEESKAEMLSVASDFGDTLSRLADKISANAGEASAQIQALNDRILMPVLSPVAISTRYGANVTLRGRDKELNRLATDKDMLVYGQPGSGKTALLQNFARSVRAHFILSDNADAVVAAIVCQGPSTVIIDDAGPRVELVRRVQHVRQERGLRLRIIAVCWPFEKSELQQVLRLQSEQIMEVGGLPRKIIAEIIGEIAERKRVKPNDQFIRVVAKQARGKPGLATSLTLATIETSGEALISGELLLKDLECFLRRHAGDEAVDVLAAFACGGRTGISTENVARKLNKPITEILTTTRRIALAGILREVEKDTLVVQPDFLRSALLKSCFFPTAGPGLPYSLCKSLIQASKEPILGYLELIHAKGRAGAAISKDELRLITSQLDDYQLWEAMAWIDPDTCQWVIETQKNLSADMKRAALHYHPEKIIAAMLSAAAIDSRPLHAFPQADMRLIEDWVTGGEDADGFQRRQTLFTTTAKWLKNGGHAPTAITALSFVFTLNCRTTDSDPADPSVLRFREWLLSLSDAKKIVGLWSDFLLLLKSLKPIPWPQVVNIVENWIQSDRPHGKMPDEYVAFIHESSCRMITDLAAFARDNQAALRWVHLRSKALGLSIEESLLSPDFMLLFPEEKLGDNWQEIEQQQTEAVQRLAEAWREKPFPEIVDALSEWQKQTDTFGRVWPQMTPEFCARFAKLYSPTDAELSFAIAKLAAPSLTPFLESSLSRGALTEQHLQLCLARQDLEGVLINFVLLGKLLQLYDELQSKFGPWTGLIKVRCLRGEVPNDVLQRLLSHPDSTIKFETALGVFRGRDRKPIPDEFLDLWKNAVIEGLTLLPSDRITHPPYDLESIFLFMPDIRKPTLKKILTSGKGFHGVQTNGLLFQLVPGLDKKERRELLKECKHLSYSPLPSLLVGRDPALYQELLEIPELKHFHLDPLCGDPSDPSWPALAKVALAAGHSPKTLASSVNSHGFSWSGHLSNYYQQWVQSFTKLSSDDDAQLKEIAVEGLKWATASCDFYRAQEKLEAVEGSD
jgi:hypothetical protein